MIRKSVKRILNYTYRPLLVLYLKWERKYYRDGIRLVVLPGVFHPGLFYSTTFMLDILKSKSLKEKNVLELGAGTGMLSVYCVKKGANVTASDISWKAIVNLDKNARWNRVSMSIIQSDLFDNIPKQIFDYVIINPPYYKKDPKTDPERAWYCGKNMEYFSRLFKQIPGYLGERSVVLMVLSEDCDIDRIKELAEENKLVFNLLAEKKLFLETNYIYKISLPTGDLPVLSQFKDFSSAKLA
ncbi:MAG: methyltransferase [Bacteroidia bacterium]|nr:methyltransferase [Bacteroidia bacterium]